MKRNERLTGKPELPEGEEEHIKQRNSRKEETLSKPRK